MARNRASRGAKLLSVTIVSLGIGELKEEVLKLREHVTHLEFSIGRLAPAWDEVSSERDE